MAIATGYTVTPLSTYAFSKKTSLPFTVSAVGGVFNPAGNGETITVTAEYPGDLVATYGTNATIIGPSTGPQITFQPDSSVPSFQFTITPAQTGFDSIAFTNNQGWTDSRNASYLVSLDFTTQVYQAIIAILRKSNLILAIVNANNIIDITSQQYQTEDPIKAAPQAGDLPELMLLQGRFSSKLEGANSLQSSAAQTYILWVTTDTPEVGGESAGQVATLNSLKMALDFTFATATDDTLGLPYVFTRELRGGPDLKDSEKKDAPNRGAKRWAAVYAIDVLFSFSPALLQNYAA